MEFSRRRGFTLIELLIVIAIIVVIAAISTTHLASARMQGAETAAAQEVRTLQIAQTQYFSQFGRFATSLVELGPAVSGEPGPGGADLIPWLLAQGRKGGYVFSVPGNKGGYSISAAPESYKISGRRSFYSDQTQVIRQNWAAEAANAGSEELR